MAKDCTTCLHGHRTKGPSAISTENGAALVVRNGDGINCRRPGDGKLSIDLTGDGMRCSGWEPRPENTLK